MAENEKFDCWCIVNLFGHQRIAGRVTEQQIGGQAFVRVDVPAVGEKLPFTRMFGAGAIYSIDPVSEAVCRGAAATIRAEPVSVYDMPPVVLRALQDSQQRQAAAIDAEDPED